MPYWIHWFLWVTLVGGAVGGWSSPAPVWVGETLWGLGVGSIQWVLLRWQWPMIPWWGWILATVGGFWAGAFVLASPVGDGLFGAVVAGLLRGGVCGWLQWRILRYHLTQIRGWILLSALGWSFGAVWLGWGGVGLFPAYLLCVATATAVQGRILQQRLWVGDTFS